MSTHTWTQLHTPAAWSENWGGGGLENGIDIDIWRNGYLQGKDLLRQPNPLRNQAWCAADFFSFVNLTLFLFVGQINNF